MRLLLLLLLCPALHAAPVINEFMAANAASLTDEDGAFSDWIEIYNPDAAAVNLAGYGLTDNAAQPLKWVFPSITLAPGGYRVVFASSKNRTNPAANLHTNFSLAANGEYLALTAPGGAVLQEFAPAYPRQQDDLTYGLGRRVATTDHLSGATPVVKVPGNASDLLADWNAPAFTATGWITGTAPGGLGYDRAVAPPNLINTATTGTATQSSEFPGYPAPLAIDGQNGNFTHTDGNPAPPWWQVAWTADRAIYTITLHNRAACCPGRLRDITVEVLAADLTTVLWTSPLLNAENVLNGPAAITVDVLAGNGGAPVTGRAVKVRRANDSDWSGLGAVAGNAHDANTLSLGEVTVMVPDPNNVNPPPGIQNLAPAGTATQTSTLGGFAASLGIDGNTGNFTHTLNSDTTPAWTLNLRRRALISEITLNNRGDGCCQYRLRDITVEILDADGVTVVWTSPLLNPENTDGSPQLLDLDVAGLNGGPVIGNFVRVRRTPDDDFSGQGGVAGSADDARVISLGEVSVPGEPVVNYDTFIATDIEAVAWNQNASAFARWNFNVASTAAYDSLKLAARYDDGFIVWLNGVKIAERNAPAAPAWNSAATINRDDALAYREEIVDLTASLDVLQNGSNVLAVQMLNNAAGDEDFLCNGRLLTTTVPEITNAYLERPTPGAVNDTGYFLGRVADTSFSTKRGIYTAAFAVTISTATPGAQIRYTLNGTRPTATTGTVYAAPISITTTTILRAAAFRTEWQPTNVDTQTYIFPAQLFGSAVMNQTIMTNPAYAAQLMPALTGLPIVSLVFNGEIARTEKLTSMELIGFGDGDVQQDCGMAQFGSYVTNFAKRSVRLYFRNEYGAGKLRYPLFKGYDRDIAATDEFDAIDLRQGSHDMVDRGYYLSNPLCDDTLLDMGHLNPHGRFIHVMVNGQYWGLYHLRERWNASMHSQYLGGVPEEYEGIVSNRGGGPWSAGVPYDGTGAHWNTMLTKRSDWPGIQPYLDTAQFIDFMLLFMSGDAEAEQRSVSPAVPGSGFKFYLNDADGWTRSPPDRTLNEGPENIMQMLRAAAHPDYKATVADRIQRHYYNGGAMTQGALFARHDARATQMEIPFVLEAARWGYRTVDSWVAAKNSYRNSILNTLTTMMISRFKTHGLLPATDAPVLSQHGGNVAAGYELTMSGAGNIYYTTNNTDPRLPGGAVSPAALPYVASQQNETLVASGAVWRFSDTGANHGGSDVVFGHASYGAANWKHPAFNTESPLWGTGAAELGYSDSPVTTVSYGPDANNKFITTYFRRTFTVTNLAQISALTLRVKRDDGAIIYLNGREAGRSNMTAGTVYQSNTVAPVGVGGADEETFFIVAGVPLSHLQEGVNTIAVEVHQNAATSSDLTFDLELTATRTVASTDRIVLNANRVIKARARNGTDWSPLTEAFFTVGGAPAVAAGDVTISEIHYNPAPGLDTEFVELMNIGNRAINLRGCGFSSGFPARFPAQRDTILAPGQRTLLARSLLAMNNAYGLGKPIQSLGPRSNLDNAGESLTLENAALQPLLTVTYDNNLPWPAGADGTGPSLTLAAPRLNPALMNPLAWRPSLIAGGTPGTGEAGETTFSGNPDADPDQNGWTNFQEYVFASFPAPALQVLTVGGIPATYQTLSFRFNALAADAVVQLESSDDLQTWTAGGMVLHYRTDHANGTADITFRGTTPFAANPEPRKYHRVRMDRLP